MRLFVGVRPPGDVVAAVARLDRPRRPGVRWERPEKLHVTLRFLGEVAGAAPVVAALEAAPLRPCRAVLGPNVEALGRQVLCVPVAGLDDLAREVTAATAGFGRPPDERGFQGHLTLARLRDGGARRLAGAAFSGRFDVTDVRLVQSVPGPDGPRYEDVVVLPLG